jgi:hypothetical protein
MPSRLDGRFTINTATGCHEWTGAVGPLGYGRLRYKGKTYLATRFAYAAWVGPTPDGKEVCHRCDNPRCINPEHLWLGDHKQNMSDMADKKRLGVMRRDTCGRGHPLTPDNVYRPPGKSHRTRECRACIRLRWKKPA